MINLVLAEGHNIVRAGVRALLEKDGGFNLVAEMVTGFEVIDYVSKGMAIDVVLMDMDVPGIGGVEMIGKLKVLSPSTRVIVFTALNHEKNIRDAYAAGANGY
ncbi:MAG: response regulator transcription factor, partial [Sphingobacteriaceae bacterium]